MFFFDLEKSFPKSPQYVGNIFAESAESLLFHQLKGALKVHAPRAKCLLSPKLESATGIFAVRVKIFYVPRLIMIYGNICTNNVECFCAPELKEAEEIWADSAEIIEL